MGNRLTHSAPPCVPPPSVAVIYSPNRRLNRQHGQRTAPRGRTPADLPDVIVRILSDLATAEDSLARAWVPMSNNVVDLAPRIVQSPLRRLRRPVKVMSPYAFLASLPAILSLAGFVIYQIIGRN